jgi:hypothetical protein
LKTTRHGWKAAERIRDFSRLLSREKKLVILVGTKKAIAIAVKRVESSKRITTLKQRLVQAAGR